MTAHNPITAAQAVRMVEAAGVADARRLIADHAAAGLVKSYALVIETVEAGGDRRAIRGGSVSVDLWRRIVAEDAGDSVWGGGTVRLAPSGFIGGPPEVSITGFGFGHKSVAQLIDHLRGNEQQSAGRSRRPVQEIQESPEPPQPPTSKRRLPNPDAIPPGALLVTINQTMAALGLGRTKVNELMKSGRLERVEIDGGVRITTVSIRAVAGVS